MPSRFAEAILLTVICLVGDLMCVIDLDAPSVVACSVSFQLQTHFDLALFKQRPLRSFCSPVKPVSNRRRLTFVQFDTWR